MSRSKPDPEYYKRPYASQWASHANRVKSLQAVLVEQFPMLRDSIRVGLGADSAELIRVPPNEKNEPDLSLYHDYQVLCHIEVSGSTSTNVRIPPQPIYIRPGKIVAALAKEEAGEPYFFWMQYHDRTWVLRGGELAPYVNRAVSKDWYGVRERYCEIPATLGRSQNALFTWLRQQLA